MDTAVRLKGGSQQLLKQSKGELQYQLRASRRYKEGKAQSSHVKDINFTKSFLCTLDTAHTLALDLRRLRKMWPSEGVTRGNAMLEPRCNL